MKNRNYMLMGVALIATLLTACSNQKFAFREKVRVDRQEVAATQKTKVKTNTHKEKDAAGLAAEMPVDVAVPATAATAEASTASTPAKLEIATSTPDFVQVQNELSKEPVVSNHAKSETKKLDKASKLMKKVEHVTKPNASIDARKFIIVGLILILIGVILGLVVGWIGGLVATIGFIIALIGLIVLLMDNL